jgi:hypothetical protein
MGPAAGEILARDKAQRADRRAADAARKVEGGKDDAIDISDTAVDAAADLAKTD